MSIGAPIILGRCPSLSEHESESMLRTYLVCGEKQEREMGKRNVGEAHSVLITAIRLPQRLSCYWGKIVSLRMLTSLRFADLRLTTAQQRTTGQNLPSDLYQESCRRVRMTLSLSSQSVKRLYRKLGASTSHNPRISTTCHRDSSTFSLSA
jgi:hypothetical protein